VEALAQKSRPLCHRRVVFASWSPAKYPKLSNFGSASCSISQIPGCRDGRNTLCWYFGHGVPRRGPYGGPGILRKISPGRAVPEKRLPSSSAFEHPGREPESTGGAATGIAQGADIPPQPRPVSDTVASGN